MVSLSHKKFENIFTHHFPGDRSGALSPRETPGVVYSSAMPSPVGSPRLLAWSEPLARELNIDFPDELDLSILAGNYVTPSMDPYANCYGGHQFGSWAGQLGDGRAITLGEWTSSKDRWELQLKGAGPTPYSRGADGRAVLRSSVREYLVSEAMHYLGVPTTRALSLVTTGEKVLRDMFYDGNPEYETGAVILRTAPSFLRFGSFEILLARNETELLEQLLEWTINSYFPDLKGPDKILHWFQEVMNLTVSLMVEWERVGFVHGVMNTDNMSILGLTIDYGPFSFLDNYDPNFTPNTTDLPGRRYAFGKQYTVAHWNLIRLATAILPVIGDSEPLEEILNTYASRVDSQRHKMMSKKLGLYHIKKEDERLLDNLEDIMNAIQPDMTIFYRLLMDLPSGNLEVETIFRHFDQAFYEDPKAEKKKDFVDWLQEYQHRRTSHNVPEKVRYELMAAANPSFVPRNYLLHQAIERLEAGEDNFFREIQQAIKTPYAKDPSFFQKRPKWATEMAGCSMLSCSS